LTIELLRNKIVTMREIEGQQKFFTSQGELDEKGDVGISKSNIRSRAFATGVFFGLPLTGVALVAIEEVAPRFGLGMDGFLLGLGALVGGGLWKEWKGVRENAAEERRKELDRAGGVIVDFGENKFTKPFVSPKT